MKRTERISTQHPEKKKGNTIFERGIVFILMFIFDARSFP